MTITLYGISNCDTVKKARAWLTANGSGFTFHDYGRLGLPDGALERWSDAVGWESLLNRRGTTWRRLDAAQQAGAVDAAGANALMQAHPSLIKRPVVEWDDGTVTVGFDAILWAAR